MQFFRRNPENIRAGCVSVPRLRLLGLCAVSAAVAVFCQDIFSTRDPEPPESVRTTFVQPVSPEVVLENFIAAIRERNAENYIRCFGSSEEKRGGFQFVPERTVAENYQDRFAGWNVSSERAYITNLFAQIPDDSLSTLLLSDVADFQYADSVRLTKDYSLSVGHVIPGIIRTASGRMDISLKKGDDALWYISYWADFRTTGRSVWSVLKAEF